MPFVSRDGKNNVKLKKKKNTFKNVIFFEMFLLCSGCSGQ